MESRCPYEDKKRTNRTNRRRGLRPVACPAGPVQARQSVVYGTPFAAALIGEDDRLAVGSRRLGKSEHMAAALVSLNFSARRAREDHHFSACQSVVDQIVPFEGRQRVSPGFIAKGQSKNLLFSFQV